MPTALDYRAAADRFRRLADRLADDLEHRRGPSALDPDAVAGGPVAVALRGSLATVDALLRRAVDELVRLAEVCDRRADVCAEFARAMRQYRDLDPMTRRHVRAPAPPAHWVDS